jgi:HSP20 family protein
MAMLFSSDPVDALLQFQQALDAFRTSGWLGSSPSGSGAYPPLNVFRKGDDLVVITEVPGIRKSDLQIQVKGNTIRIAGAKSVEYGGKASLHRRARLFGNFDRAITVPV